MKGHPSKLGILLLNWLAQFLMFFNYMNFTPIMPVIAREFAITHADAGLLVTSTTLAGVAVLLATGILIETYNWRKSISFILFLLFIPLLLSAFAKNYSQFFFSRLFLGIGTAIFIIGARMLSAWFPAGQMGLAQGVFGGAANAGATLAAILIPLFSGIFGWRAAFALAALPLLPLSALFWLYVRETPTGDRERRPKAVTLEPLKSKQAWLISFTNLAAFGTLLCIVAWLPSYFHETYFLSTTDAGLLASLAFATGAVTRPLGGFIGDKIGRKKTMLFSLIFLSAAYLILGLTGTLAAAVFASVGAGVFTGLASGALLALPPLIFKKTPGPVFGLAGSFGIAGGLILSPAFGYLIDINGRYNEGFLMLLAVTLLCAFTAFLIKEPDGVDAQPPEVNS